MRLLLDTHALAWFALDSPSLSSRARQAIEEQAEATFVSAVTAFEIATKHRLGKWPQVKALAADFNRIVAGQGFEALPFTARHATLAGAFPNEHRDPFDRQLAAQAMVEQLTVVSVDPALDAFGVNRLW